MIRNIYHGSTQIIRAPRFGAGDAYNDFGLGFYCTDIPDLAAEWAVELRRNGFVNKYTLNDTGLRIIDLGSPQYNILHWISLLTNFREFDTTSSLFYQGKEYIRNAFAVDYQNCDCIIGLCADNSNFAFAQDFLSGRIDHRQLKDAVIKGNSGRQFVLKSNRAFERVVFEGYDVAWSKDRYPSRISRDKKLLASVSAVTRSSGEGLYITQILDEEIKPYDHRLR
ncbi:MAG: DUF3990 domain-containing protein [Mogibacterium sp.]|nr:DUF3990 domain-containing protein [Mogibacterium sp.]